MTAPRILFHRDFRGQTGGHGKVWNYFNHALALGLDARVYLADGSLRDDSNPWLRMPERVESDWRPDHADLLFVGGMDWLAVAAGLEERLPVINLVQHVRHADAGLPLRQFLRRRATRICVSQPVADAILATGEPKGRTVTIPAALDIAAGGGRPSAERAGIFIDGLKAPALGVALAARLAEAAIAATLSRERMPRAHYLQALAAAEVAVVLPHPTEGFYLPGLEAMALGCPVAMPPCVGSAAYAIDETNCLMPAADADALLQAVLRLRDPSLRARLRHEGLRTAGRFTLDGERDAFGVVLEAVLGGQCK